MTAESFAGDHNNVSSTNISSSLMTTLDNSEKLRSVILISDGSWNEGANPLDAAIKYRSKGVPVFTLSSGRDQYLPDLIIEKVDAPTFGLVNEKILIPFSIRNYLNRDLAITVTLKNSRLVRLNKTLRIPAGQLVSDSIVWQPRNLKVSMTLRYLFLSMMKTSISRIIKKSFQLMSVRSSLRF